jgi:hypothetical protein
MSQTFEEIFLGRFSHCLFSIYNVAVSLKVTQVEFGKQHDLGLWIEVNQFQESEQQFQEYTGNQNHQLAYDALWWSYQSESINIINWGGVAYAR